ncbi:D-alanine--D-alanine ligase family protein [Pseudonocardia endophytica]|uniref:D-alanine-D-alanine ligase n=1 Tax=Pseudonocardia endophytica TaxID=401976 RepID=A0A4R1HVY2_PSEEN|nr:D-alanine--D-alanine ligase [Pseudonocardia endophytica]TCK25601.1 D-alanine-D-alanine ligase [Pseudonocardia endophytica]
MRAYTPGASPQPAAGETRAALRVLHLTGSAVSDEFVDLSLLYARDCLAATADPARWEPHLAHVTPDGCWRFPWSLEPEVVAASTPVTVGDAIRMITELAPDVMVPQMFCPPGMTGHRALFDVLGVPYVGNRPDATALSVDKPKARAVVAASGVDVPRGEVVRPGGRPTLAPPVVVKPVDADNSSGVTLVRSTQDYDDALTEAFRHSSAALVEEYVELGREVRCGVLERDGALVGLPLEEYAMDRTSKPVRGYDDKLARSEDGDLRLMAKDGERAWIVDPSDPATRPVQDAARACYAALGCRHYGLFDFRIDPSGRPFFLEASLYCSFATTSVVATMARAAGIELPELFATSVEAALRS